MKKSFNCMRCDVPMEFLSREEIQLGKTGWLLWDLSNLVSGNLEVSICRCPNCGKLEFFDVDVMKAHIKVGEAPETFDMDFDRGYAGVSAEGYPQRNCPQCGVRHDFDYPRCPQCGYAYPEFQ